jgi:competence protein ComEC
MGCQLSFLYVAVLIWGVGRWREEGEVDPLDVLIEQSRPKVVQWLRARGWQIARWYGTTLILGLAISPMVASWQNLISFSGFVIGPPLIILAAIALIFGFLMLLAAPLGLAAPFAFVVRWDLAACEGIVDLTKRLPWNHVYVPDLPAWWLWGFYLAILALLWLRPVWKRPVTVIIAGAMWIMLGFLLPGLRLPSDELRVTFLAVGHGGCTVLETPDGKTLIYDAGAMDGPDVTRMHIAPYLWSRGRRYIDELFLSHADLDHFNGVAALLDRFEIGQVTCTPSFADKDLPGVRRTLALIREHNVPMRVVHSGEQLSAGEVTIEILHPPPRGPDGTENVRSMVLRVEHRGHSILLTGDLESPGLERVAQGHGGHVDVLMAPHHGSAAANNRLLAEWARPRLVVACDSRPLKVTEGDPYGAVRAEVWVTGLEGAVTIHSHVTGMTAETFRTGKRLVVRTGSQ